MNILIKNLSNTYNYGSMMMGENLIHYLSMYSKKEINFYIETDDKIHIERLKEATKYEKIYQNKIVKEKSTSKNRIMRKIERTYINNKLYKKYQEVYNYIFILGGDDYSEEYYDIKTEGKYVIQLLKELKKLDKKVPIYMIGQTIGPFTGKRKQVASKVFDRLNLYTRDEKNYIYLKKELNCNPKRMHDLAFLDLTLQNANKEEKIKKYNLESNKYIVFIGTGLMHHYTNNNEKFVDKFYEIVKKVKKENKDKKIVWLSHVVGSESSDNKMLDILLKRHNEIEKEMTIIKEALLPVEARMILGNAYFSLSCRMHAAVSSYQMGKPCICYSYSPKFAGVIGKEFDLEDYIIESKGNDFWESNNSFLEEKTAKIMNDIENNYSEVTSKIKVRVEQIKEENIEIIKALVKDLEE